MKKIIKKYRQLSNPVKASLWYILCNVLNKGVALISTPIFTRILTEEQYGTFALFQSWYSIILIFSSLNIFLGGYTKGLLLFKEDKERFTSASLGLTSFITIFIGVIYLIGIEFWTNIFELPPTIMAMMFVELTFMPALEFWAAKERFDFKYQKYVAVTLAMTMISMVGGILAVLSTTYKVEARVFTDVLAKSVFAVVLFVLMLFKGKTIFVKEYWLYNLKFNIPLLPHYLSNYILNQSDRIMIGKMIGMDKAAYYSVAYNISMMMNLIINAVNNALNPFIYKTIDLAERGEETYENARKRIEKATAPLFVLVAGLCVMTMAFAPEIIYVFAGEKYVEAIYVIPPIVASVFFIFLYIMFSTIEYYYQKSGRIAIATSVSAVLNLSLNYIFINIYGYYAAGYTTLICYICLSIMHYIFYRTVLKEKFPISGEIYNKNTIVLISISLVIFMTLMVFTYKMMIIRYSIITVILIVMVIKRKYIIGVFKTFRK